jgi:NAD(P)-dependent dehydrogenase (short-subunit alcohol dehydrogenase family)
MASIRGRVAVVTGASSGIGEAAALALEQAGFLTIATARDEQTLTALRERGCETLQLDVTDEASLVEAVRTTENRFGPIYALVNNAGAPQYGPIEEVSLDAIRRVFEVNVFGLIRLCQLVLPGMRRVGAGRIINVSSVAGEVNQPGGGVYHATKHALEALTETLRMEVAEFGVDVISVLPGPVDTAFGPKAVSTIPELGPASPYAAFKAHLAQTMVSAFKPDSARVLSPEDVARVIVRAATAPRPDTRYHVGTLAKMTAVLRGFTPDRVWEAAMRRGIPNS